MDKKDDRFKDKRKKMKQYKNRKYVNAAATSNNAKPGTSNSSSSQQESKNSKRSAVIDVADSSDEPKTWIGRGSRKVAPQQNQRLLEMPSDEEEIEQHPQMNAGNFKLLAQRPPAIGGFFKFSAEPDWETAGIADDVEEHESETSKYFTLSRKLLNAGLQTIPFFKRMDYPATMFTKQQIERMEKEAELAEEKYQSVLREHREECDNVNNANKQRSAGSSKKATVIPPVINADADALDDLLNITQTDANLTINSPVGSVLLPPAAVAASTGTTTATTKQTDDIQDWLDGVLDE